MAGHFEVVLLHLSTSLPERRVAGWLRLSSSCRHCSSVRDRSLPLSIRASATSDTTQVSYCQPSSFVRVTSKCDDVNTKVGALDVLMFNPIRYYIRALEGRFRCQQSENMAFTSSGRAH